MNYHDVVFFIILMLCFLLGILFIRKWKHVSKILFLCIPVLCFYCNFVYNGKETTGKVVNNNQQQDKQRKEKQWAQDKVQKENNKEIYSSANIDNELSIINEVSEIIESMEEASITTNAGIINRRDMEKRIELVSKGAIITQYIYKQIEDIRTVVSSAAIQVQVGTGEGEEISSNEKQNLENLEKAMKVLKHKIKNNKSKKVSEQINKIWELIENIPE